jgi:hypothetical protein
MTRTGLAVGALVQLRHGVVIGAEHWPSDPGGQHLVRSRAELAANPGAVLSHQSAVLVWQLPTPGFTPWSALPVSVTLPVSGHTSHAATAVHHVADVASSQVLRDPHGYATTSPYGRASRLDPPKLSPDSLDPGE